MILLFVIFVITFFIGMKIHIQDFNNDYLSKPQTTIINGFFVVNVIFNHFCDYINKNALFDKMLGNLIVDIRQLMVTTFLFYSGYGILESIKNKTNYLKDFPKKRFFPLWFNLSLSVTLFLIMNMILNINYPTSQILSSYIGYGNIGNSNWYIFTTFILYIFVLMLFNNKVVNKIGYKGSLLLITVFTIIYIGIWSLLVGDKNYFVNTALCFPFGMWYSYYKPSFEAFFKKNYVLKLFLFLYLFAILFTIKKNTYYLDYNFAYNIYSISFLLVLIICSMKVGFYNPLFEFFGKHIFWIYVLQRLPMIYFQGKFDNNYIYFAVCFIITVGLSYFMNKLSKYILKKE